MCSIFARLAKRRGSNPRRSTNFGRVAERLLQQTVNIKRVRFSSILVIRCMRKEKIIICQECGNSFKTVWNNKFCGHSCSAKYSNKNRPPLTEEHRRKIRDGVKRAHQEHPEWFPQGQKHIDKIAETTRGKYRGNTIQSILDVSNRTISKILKRLNLGCCICGWNEGSCDIHHINGKKVQDANGHWNLTIICPNHHRLCHSGKIKKETLISLLEYFPKNWKEMYYG